MQKFTQLESKFQTGREWLHWCAEQFEQAELYYGHGTTDHFSEALSLVMHVQDIMPADVDERIDEPLENESCRKLYDIAAARIESRKPLPYLTGEAWFAGMKFRVDERVLITRSPFAELITNGFQPWLGSLGVRRILDMCTGSGCIAIAAAKRFPEATVDAVDISEAALDLAAENVGEHGMESRLNLVQSDGFADLRPADYDLVLCNPPYVDKSEMAALPEEYRFEPEIGLAAGDDGLDFVRQFLVDVPRYLADNALVFVEVGASADAMARAYPRLPLTWLELASGGDGIFMLGSHDFPAVH